MKIKEIKLKSFRAYKNEIFRIPENKNIILFYARNGFGKTSFFDGVEWGLTGRLLRYDQSARERNEYPVLRNSFSEPSDSDGVEIIFSNDSSVKRFIKNDSNDYAAGLLNLNGHVIESLSEGLVKESYQNKINFERSFNFSQLLSQDLISDFIRHTADPDRYRTVVNLFGLDSYKNYDEHIQNTKVIIKDKLSYLKSEIQLKKSELEIERAKLTAIDMNEKVIIQELEIIYKSTIDVEKLEQYKQYFNNLKSAINFDIHSIDSELKILLYIKDNHKIKEKRIEEYTVLKESLESLNQFKIFFSKKKYFENIIKNLNEYRLFLEQKIAIEQNEKDLNILYQLINTNPFFKIEEDNDKLIENLSLYKIDLKDRIEKYFEFKNTIKINKSSIRALLISLEELCSLKNKLLHSAKEFFEINENKNLTNCPVCDNNFDINITVQKIEEQLNINLKDTDFLEINSSITKLRNNNEELMNYLIKEESELLKIINDIRVEKESKYDVLLKKSREYDLLKESYRIVTDNLILLKINIESFEKDKARYFEELEKYREYINTVSEEYYQKLYEEKNQSLNSIYSNIQLYIQYKEKLKFIDLETLTEQIKQKETSLNENKIKMDSFNNALNLISSLEVYFSNNEILKNISSLMTIVNELNIENNFLIQLDSDYTDLKQSIKKTIDEQTKNLLNEYQATIKKFYHYLNPNVYMRNLSIKETQNNANRLVFEVCSDESSNKHSPSYIFSSAQNNVLALSIFLSFAIKQQWSELDAIFLDDPIQNMDDINIHSFVDLIRSIEKQTNKQFFISTHDERIYQFMLNKFGRENVHTFTYEDYGVLKNTAVSIEPTMDNILNDHL